MYIDPFFAKRVLKKSPNPDHNFIPIRANFNAKLCDLPINTSKCDNPNPRTDDDASTMIDTIPDQSIGESVKCKKLKRGHAVRRLLKLRGGELIAERLLMRRSKKKFYSLLSMIVIKLLLASVFVYLILMDFRNSFYRVSDASKIRPSNFEVGAYPMSGMLLLASSCCLDLISVSIFACGFLCQCGYFRYYMRFIFVDFIMTFTAVCTLFISERKAVSYLKEFFRIVLEYEYGESEAKMGTDFVDTVQAVAKCCGYSKPGDWTKSKWYTKRNVFSLILPESCCDDRVENRSMDDIPCFDQGCDAKIFSTMAQTRMISQYLAIVKALILLISMLLCAAMYRDYTTALTNANSRSIRRREEASQKRSRRIKAKLAMPKDGRAIGTDMNSNALPMNRQLFQMEEKPSADPEAVQIGKEK